ncbi:capsular polysaccharide biosynthesis protein [Marinilactibacillus psychrotolerans 42ea]|uniref:Capsular polysaccharide biosynthesis protein n=1 Tax=Marinilactibacillus psychrotolerans 42ea TaxID=1255609 RepID=A0A1R4K1E6_9LACT|nr:EpsG family protein [Marinilactibacillus psychrotolerans]SJN37863.1 capsular polysaccharide biosynthesis protein [Marinilactibacillus psychrotolerans 42ea]
MLFQTLLIVGLLLLGIFLTSAKKVFGNKLYLLISFFTLFILSAFRSINIGNDTEDYLYMFQNFGQSQDIFGIDTRIEIGYVALNKVLFLISSNPLILFGVTSAFVIGVFMLFMYKNSNIFWFSVFLFINLRIYYFTLSGIRQAIALAIILISYKFIKERKPIPFSLLVLLASSFHASAIFFFLVYPLSKIKYSKKVMLMYTFVGGVLFLTFNYTIGIILNILPQYENYLSSSYFESIKLASIIDFIIILLIFLFGLFTSHRFLSSADRRLVEENSKNSSGSSSLNILLHIISLAVMITFIAINGAVIKRAALYFFMFAVIFIPYTIQNIKNKKVRVLTLYLIFVLVFAYNLIILIYRPEWQRVYPFEFFWQLK